MYVFKSNNSNNQQIRNKSEIFSTKYNDNNSEKINRQVQNKKVKNKLNNIKKNKKTTLKRPPYIMVYLDEVLKSRLKYLSKQENLNMSCLLVKAIKHILRPFKDNDCLKYLASVSNSRIYPNTEWNNFRNIPNNKKVKIYLTNKKYDKIKKYSTLYNISVVQMLSNIIDNINLEERSKQCN